MAILDVPKVTPSTVGRSNSRQTWSKVGQYALLVALSLLVLGPIFLTIKQALSPPFAWANAGRPIAPVDIAWKDRTWWSGGVLSLAVRTGFVAFVLAWLQKVAGDFKWSETEKFLTPPRILAIIGGTLAVGFTMSPLYQSFFNADGNTLKLFILSVVVVAAVQAWGFLSSGQSIPGAAISALSSAFLLVGGLALFAGPEVWTSTWSRYNLSPAMGRSFVMSIIITVAQVTTAIMAAYAFVFLRFPFKRVMFALFMATMLLPLEVTLVGNIATIRQLNWINTYQGLVAPFCASALGTFLIRQGFKGLPSEIRDATRLDGYGHFAFMTKFAVPLTRPVIASFTVIAALQAWNQYLWPRSVIESNSFNTLQIQLRLVSATEVAAANQAVAAALVAAVPVIILLIAFQRQIIRGLTAGAVK